VANKVIANKMRVKFDTYLHNTLNGILWSGAEEAAATLGGMAKDILRKLYPDRKTLMEEVKSMMQEELYCVVKAVLYKLLGVRFSSWGDGQLDFSHDNDTMDELLKRFKVDVDAMIRKTDMAKVMKEIMTEELQRYLGSEDFLDAARNIAGEKIQEQVHEIMAEEASKIKLDELEVDDLDIPARSKKERR
jgi:hypothetical protein